MRSPLVFLFLLLAFMNARAQQNLVPNPSFEEYTSYPTFLSEIAKAVGWRSYTGGTSDYYHTMGSGGVGIPMNNFGDQQPLGNDSAYAGIYAGNSNGYREYLAATISSLQIGGEYEVTIFASLADGANVGVDGLGVYFFDSGPNVWNYVGNHPLPVTPQIDYSSYGPITEKTNWVKLTDTLVADSAYDNIVIGGFKPEATINVVPLPSGNRTYAYYYIDSVIVKNISQAKVAVISVGNSFCGGDSVKVRYSATAFNAGNIFTLQLSDNTGDFANATVIAMTTATSSGELKGVVPSSIVGGSGYKVRITASDPAFISSSDTTNITINRAPVIEGTSNSPVCEGNPLNLTVNSSNPNVTYNWIGPVYVSSSQNINVDKASLTHAGQHIVTVTANGCSARDTVNVVVSSKPNFINTAVDEIACKGDSLNVSAETDIANAMVKWSSTTGFASNFALNLIYPAAVANSGVYTVYAISPDGCSSDTLNKEVNVVELKAKATTNAPILYYGDTLYLSTEDNPVGTQYAWSGPGGFVSDMQNPQVPDVTDKQQGDYYVTASLSGCSVKAKVYQQVLAAKRFKLFSNPNNGNFTIKGRILKDQEVPIEIINYMGQVVYRDHAKAVNYRFEKTISLEGGFTNGLYFVRLGIDGKTEDLRFILAR